MKRFRSTLLVGLFFGSVCFAEGEWPFFAFCMDTHDANKRTIPEQAKLLQELGYDGCGHLWLGGAEERAKTLTESGLRLFQVYLRVNLSKPGSVDEKKLAEVLPVLASHRPQLALLITGGKPSDTALDARAVTIINRLADLAKPHQVSIVLYPHANDWLETVGDGVRITQKINRPGEVGVMFNLCHWMKADPERNLQAVLKTARPWLKAVSLSGSDTPEQIRTGKGNWIQPLDAGAYAISDFLAVLRTLDYTGPIGLQCYGLKGDARIHLERSRKAWERLGKN